MHYHPVRKGRGQTQLRNGIQIVIRLDGGVRRSTAMRFDQNGNAAALAQLCYTLEDLDILREAKNIPARMTIDKRDLTLRGKLELHFETLNMILVSLSLGQDLTNEAQPIISMEARDLCRRFVERTQIDFSGIKATGLDSLKEDLQRIIPHFPFGFTKEQFQN